MCVRSVLTVCMPVCVRTVLTVCQICIRSVRVSDMYGQCVCMPVCVSVHTKPDILRISTNVCILNLKHVVNTFCSGFELECELSEPNCCSCLLAVSPCGQSDHC